MNTWNMVGKSVCVAGLIASAAFAAEWPGGASFVIPASDSVTNDAARGIISHFTDNGSLTFLPGASVSLTGNVTTAVGSGVGASGTFDLLGGSMTVTSGSGAMFIVGHMGGTGSMFIASGAEFRSSAGYFGIARNDAASRDLPSFGEVTVAGTLFTTNRIEFTGNFPNGAPQPPYPVSARLTLEQGGVVEVGELYKNDRAASELIFRGGTLRANRNHNNFIGGGGVMDIIIADGANAFFDTAGRDITIIPNTDALYADALTLRGETGPGTVGDGGLTKIGAGRLAFRLPPACNTFTGAVTVLAGTLDLGRPLAENQTVTVYPGANFIPHSSDNLAKITVIDGARMTYTVMADTDSLDLVSLSAHFHSDRLAGPFSGAPAYVLSNAVTHTVGDTAVTPFRLIGNGGTLNLTNTGLDTAYLQLEGPGTFNFQGSRDYTAADIGKIAITDGGYRQGGSFSIATPAGDAPLSLALATGRFNVDSTLLVGGLGGGHFAADGATVTLGNLLVGDTEGVSGTFSQSAGSVTVTGGGSAAYIGANSGYGELIVSGGQFIVNNDLRIASNPPNLTGNRPHGLVSVGDALFRCNGLYFSSWWPTGGTARNFEAGELRLLPGGIAEVNFLEKNDDPTSTVHFAGGTLRARSNRTPFIHATHATGTLNLTVDAGHFIDIDTQAYAVAMTNHPGVINLTGPGGFRKQGTGTFASAPDSADYAGDTLIDAGTLLVGGNNAIPDGSGKGNVHIAAGATLDVSGTRETVNRLIGAGRVTSADIFGTLGVLADNSDDTWNRAWLSGSASLAKHGTGTLTLASANAVPGNLTVHAGHVRVEPFAGYTQYRFKVEGVKTPATANSMQFSELALFNGERNITQDRIGIAYDTTYSDTVTANQTFPAAEPPEKAVDGKVESGSKWLDFRAAASRSAIDRDRVWLSVIYDAPQWITHYNWATANDSHERDPANWRLQGSDDGQAWADIHTVTDYVAPSVYHTWVEPDGFPVTLTQNTLSDTGHVTVHHGATLTLASVSETVGGIAGTGTITLDNADLTLASPADINAVFGGTLTGTGALTKDGPGTQILYGTNTHTGPTTVRDGTLLIQKLDTHRWFRFTVQEIRAPTNATQFAELALYSADGQRQNLGLTAVADTAVLQPGQCQTLAPYTTGNNEGVDKLFDGNTGTKCCITAGKSPILNDPSTWRTVIMRLTENTQEVTAYNLCTANDVPYRDPVAWKLESSVDGVNWQDVDTQVGVTPPATGERYTYYNSGSPFSLATRAMDLGTGADSDAIPACSVIEIYAGATLDIQMNETIGALRVDMQNAGTITRLIPEPNGVLHIVNAGGQSAAGLTLPLTIGSVENPSVLRSWTVYIDGVPVTGRTLGIDADGHLVLISNGTLLMLL